MSQSGHKNYQNLAAFFKVCLTILGLYALTHFYQMLTFYISGKHEKIFAMFWNIGQKWVKGSKCSHILAIPPNMLQRPIGN